MRLAAFDTDDCLLSTIILHFFTFDIDGNKAEGARLEQEVANLVPFTIPGTDITITFEAFPSMVDNKMKNDWVGCASAETCWGCGATPKSSNYVIIRNFISLLLIGLDMDPHNCMRFGNFGLRKVCLQI